MDADLAAGGGAEALPSAAAAALLLLVDVLGFLGLAAAPLLAPEDLRAQLIFGYMLAQPLSVKLAARLARFAGPQRRRYWAYVCRLLLLAAVLCGGVWLDELPKGLRSDAEWFLHWVGRHSTEFEEIVGAAAAVRPTSPPPAPPPPTLPALPALLLAPALPALAPTPTLTLLPPVTPERYTRAAARPVQPRTNRSPLHPP